MELTLILSECIENLLSDFNGQAFEENIDSYGVGAMMPQDMPQGLLSNPDLYGI